MPHSLEHLYAHVIDGVIELVEFVVVDVALVHVHVPIIECTAMAHEWALF